jgi:hypothetical protein
MGGDFALLGVWLTAEGTEPSEITNSKNAQNILQ